MSLINCTRSGCKDVFRSFLVKNATYEGNLEIPVIKPEKQIPRKLISFSKAISSRDFDCWVHFYEDDVAFERIWNNPKNISRYSCDMKGLLHLISVFTAICPL